MKKYYLAIILSSTILYSVNAVSKTNHNNKDKVKIEGIVQNMPLSFIGTWTVNNKSVEFNNATEIEGNKKDFKNGAVVELEGYYLNKKFIVKEAEIKGYEDKNDEKEENEKIKSKKHK